MKANLIKDLKKELNSIILHGQEEVKQTSITNSIEQKFQLKKITNFCVDKFKNTLYTRMDQIQLTKHEIDQMGEEVLKIYYPTEASQGKPNERQLRGFIEPVDYEKIIKLFYQFCYDPRLINIILGDTFKSHMFRNKLNNTTSPENSILYKLFVGYASHDSVDINFDNYPDQAYKTFKFELSVNRIPINKEDHYLEVLTNDFLKLPESDMIIGIPNNFIIQVKLNKPTSIYVVLQNFISDGYTIREVHQNGIISNLGNIPSNSFQEFTNFFEGRKKKETSKEEIKEGDFDIKNEIIRALYSALMEEIENKTGYNILDGKIDENSKIISIIDQHTTITKIALVSKKNDMEISLEDIIYILDELSSKVKAQIFSN